MLKKALVILVVGFAVFYLLTEPAAAADAIEGALDAVMEAFGAVAVFFEELIS